MKKLSIIILLLFSISNAFSQPTIPNISKTKFQIGDQVVYSFSLPLEKASELSTYILTEKKDSLEIIKQTIDTTKKNGKEFLDVKFYFTSFVEGKHKIINQNGRSFEYEVTSYPIDTTSFEIKDIKANVKEPFTIKEIMPIIIWVLIAIGLIILSYFSIKLWKKYRKTNLKEIFIKPKPILPAHEIALNSLEQLRLKRLIENNRIKEYYSEISEILRIYLDDRFSIIAIEMTTQEILSQIRDCEFINKESFSLLKEVLEYSDLVKFAKYTPTSHLSEKCMQDAIEFVNNTKLIVEDKEKEVKND
jgi:hypothetical protein